MTRSRAFSPDWSRPIPFASVERAMASRGISLAKLSKLSELPLPVLTEIASGSRAIDLPTARALTPHLGGSDCFWLERERQYRVKTGIKVEESLGTYLSSILPVRELSLRGWIDLARHDGNATTAAIEFFGVDSTEQFKERYLALDQRVAFKRSEKFAVSEGALAAWIRAAELKALKLDCCKWDRSKLLASISKIRGLTREKIPAKFVPELTALLAAAGVALIILGTPKSCPISGATKFISQNRAMIVMSFRYKTDDHFWFTLFHEIGHLVHHGNELHVEGADVRHSRIEEEANGFAVEALLPDVHQDGLERAAESKFQLVRFARKIGVSPGIVVGQLQHRKIIPFNQMNFLKQRLDWRFNLETE